MVETAESDIVSPTVSAEYPYRLLGEVILTLEDLLRKVAITILDSGNECVGSGSVCLAVVECVEIVLSSFLDSSRCLVGACELFNVALKSFTDRLLTECHSETVLCVILEQ